MKPWKQLITDSLERDYSRVMPRDLEIPLDSGKIISLIGVRRSGKTNILYSLIHRLRQTMPADTLVYINLEDDRLFPLTPHDLGGFLDAYFELFPHNRDRRVYFFFDEIQNAPEWERFIRRLHDTENCSVFVTGSSAKLLSREIATSLRGRTIPFEVFPLSFSEYLRFREIKPGHSSRAVSLLKNAFAEYCRTGGFPETAGVDDLRAKQILHEYLQMIMYRDVAERHSVGNLFLLKSLIKHCFANIANPLSLSKLYNDFRSQGMQLSRNTLFDYISYLEDAYALFLVPVNSPSQREVMRNPRKLYAIDHGLKGVVDLATGNDSGRIFENIVFLQLRRQGQNICYGRQKQEIDFVLPESESPRLINVAYDISALETRNRELNGLVEGMQGLGVQEALLLTAEVEETVTTAAGKITILPLWKWLAGV
ncbi:MAG: ATPase [Desulfuromonadales bacterium GWD2_61_12]|nr:MAG: ATPase [Desulfuromonadales bacterium GWC2_61_20]OGR36608.1 MAG: ATPase [Desulfuromonadales bacterium GWD2_61_12]HAD05100.1 ATPase [Desulfuromonas sp.]